MGVSRASAQLLHRGAGPLTRAARDAAFVSVVATDPRLCFRPALGTDVAVRPVGVRCRLRCVSATELRRSTRRGVCANVRAADHRRGVRILRRASSQRHGSGKAEDELCYDDGHFDFPSTCVDRKPRRPIPVPIPPALIGSTPTMSHSGIPLRYAAARQKPRLTWIDYGFVRQGRKTLQILMRHKLSLSFQLIMIFAAEPSSIRALYRSPTWLRSAQLGAVLAPLANRSRSLRRL